MHIGAAAMENNMEVPQKFKTEVPYDPEIPLKRYLQPHVHSTYKTKIGKQPVSIHQWMAKETVKYINKNAI